MESMFGAFKLETKSAIQELTNVLYPSHSNNDRDNIQNSMNSSMIDHDLENDGKFLLWSLGGRFHPVPEDCHFRFKNSNCIVGTLALWESSTKN
jgi:hypothetical protein